MIDTRRIDPSWTRSPEPVDPPAAAAATRTSGWSPGEVEGDGFDTLRSGDDRLFGSPVGRPGASAVTSLLSGDAADGQVNGLDRAVDHLRALPPAMRKSAELVILSDGRAGADGTAGQAVVRRDDGSVLDPSSGHRYASTEDFLTSHPHHREAGALPGDQAQRILDAPAGSPARAQALAEADSGL
jgi:hypothetical protein